MNAQPLFDHSTTCRSEAFAEDVEDLLSTWQPVTQPRPRRRLIVNLLPLLVALVGVAFAIVPPVA